MVNIWINSYKLSLTKAKEIHLKQIRLARASKFTDLDIEYQRATETSADTSAIVANLKPS